MNPTLSVLLPVHNAQTKIGGLVQRLLEVLPELTPRFDVMIVDDGSTDATCEVAYEIARDYPQIKVVRHAKPLGWAAAVSKQASHARGEFLIIHCGGDIRAQDVVGLWRLHDGIAAAAKARATAARSDKSLRFDAKSDRGGDKSSTGFVETLEGVAAGSSSSAGNTRIDTPPLAPKKSKNEQAFNKVCSTDNAKQQIAAASPAAVIGGLGIHARAPRSNLLLIHRQQVAELQQSLAKLPVSSWLSASSTRPKEIGSGGVKRPSFLSRVKSFTLGE